MKKKGALGWVRVRQTEQMPEIPRQIDSKSSVGIVCLIDHTELWELYKILADSSMKFQAW